MDDLSSSRAGALALVGGDLALDFVNTCSARGLPAFREHLARPEHVAEWAGHAKVLPPADALWLAGAVRVDAPLGERLLQQALAQRDDIHAIAAEIAGGRCASPKPVERLARVHASALAQATLTQLGGNFGWTWPLRAAPVEAVLGPVSLSALALLQQADLGRVKQCPGENCGWLFFDATKNGSRRWCEMEVCGNRAKQKRFARRRPR